MRIFNYDAKTGELLGAGVARQDPKDADHYLVPAYSTTIEPPDLTAEQVALFDVQAQTWSIVTEDRGVWYTDEGGEVVVSELGEKPDSAVTREAPPAANQKWEGARWIEDTDRKAAAELVEINGSFESQMRAIYVEYPLSEIFSWPKQEAEARALMKDPNAPAPLLQGIATNRGIALMDLADKVINKADTLVALIGPGIGLRQRARDQLDEEATGIRKT